MNPNRTMKKVLCPVEGRNGKTHWLKMGIAYENKDQSWNVYLDALPTNGKLHIREWEERDASGVAGAATQDEIPF